MENMIGKLKTPKDCEILEKMLWREDGKMWL